MDYNLAGIRNRVLNDKLDDDEFDPDIVDNFINDAQREIWNQFELPFQEKIFSGTIPAGYTMFQMPSDVALVQSQTMAGAPNFINGKMRWREFFKAFPDNANELAAAPYFWTTYGGNFIFSAPTDKDYKLTIFYIRKPTTLSGDADVPEIPEEFSELLVLGAFRRVLERNEDYDLANSVQAQYLAQQQLLVDRYGFREADGPVIMQNTQIRN